MIKDVLIVGGGVGGMSTAIALRAKGVKVTLIDKDPEWRVIGAGISITGISLRAFEDLGVLDEFRRDGFVTRGLRLKSFTGEVIKEITVPDEAPLVARGGAIMRPALHRILSTRVRDLGTEVRLGVSVEEFVQDAGGVDVTFSDGQRGRYDLVVAADGIFSSTRERLFPDYPKPQYVGQGCWRIVAPRAPDVDHSEMYYGGPFKVGLNPVNQDNMYMFVLENLPDNPRFTEAQKRPYLKNILEPFGGNVAPVREWLHEGVEINYRPIEWLLVPEPWHKGRIVLIGDAVHATTPHMASGAGIALEDGLVLAQELQGRDDIDAALMTFTARRNPRCKLVVENSVRIARLEMTNGGEEDAMATTGSTMAELMLPY